MEERVCAVREAGSHLVAGGACRNVGEAEAAVRLAQVSAGGHVHSLVGGWHIRVSR